MTPFSAVRVATSTSSPFSFLSVREGRLSPMSMVASAAASGCRVECLLEKAEETMGSPSFDSSVSGASAAASLALL